MLTMAQTLAIVLNRLEQLEMRASAGNVVIMREVVKMLTSMYEHFAEIDKRGYENVETIDLTEEEEKQLFGDPEN